MPVRAHAEAATLAPTVDPAAIPAEGIGVALGDSFRLHSLPGSGYRIVLDFDGHVATGTPWSDLWGVASVVSPAYSLDADPAFDAAELLSIQRIWQQVAEIFSPFNIDVTTEDPGSDALTLEDFGDTQHGIRVVVTQEPGKPYGGISWIGSFNYAIDTPAYVYAAPLGNQLRKIAVAAAHEAGHALGLGHDGRGTSEYDAGHGSGAASWAPVMGVGYDAAVLQWSRGQYRDATSTEDDLARITSLNFGVGWRADEAGQSRAAAAALGGTIGADGIARVQRHGIIGGSGAANDIDRYSFTLAAGGAVELTVSAWSAAHLDDGAAPVYSPLTHGMLDVKLTLYLGSTVIAGFDDPARRDAVISVANLAAGTYSLAIDGTGWGTPNGAPPSGWTEYGSLGQYMISGTYTALPPPDRAPPAAPVIDAILDDTAPRTGPLAPGGTTNDTTPTLSGLAEPGSSLALREGATLLGTALAGADGRWTLTGAALGEGMHALAVTATDAAGNASAATPLSLRVDSIAPAAPLILGVAAGAPFGTAEAGSLVAVLSGTTLLGSVAADAAGAWSLPGAGLAGPYSLVATATDAAGNLSAASPVHAGPVRLAADRAAVSLAEPGGTAELVLRVLGLDAAAAPVGVTLAGLDPREAGASATTLVLDAAHGWSATLRLTGRDDRDADGAQTRTLLVSAPGLAPLSVAVTTLDDELAATAYTRAGVGTIDTTAFAAADGRALAIAERLSAAGSYVMEQRWRFAPGPGDAVLHVKASATEAMRLQYSLDEGATWLGVRPGGVAPGPATAWDGDYAIPGITAGLIVRLVDQRGTIDTLQDSAAVDLMTLTPLPPDAASLAPLG